MWRYWLLQKISLQKWLFSAEFLGDDSTSTCFFLFDHDLQVLSHIKQRNPRGSAVTRNIIDPQIPPKNYFSKQSKTSITHYTQNNANFSTTKF